MTNRSVFPNSIDSFNYLSETLASDRDNVERYKALLMQETRTSEEEVEFSNLKSTLYNAGKIVNSESFNKIFDCMTNLEDYFLNKVMTDISKTDVGALRNDLGFPENLSTANKTNIVSAINELNQFPKLSNMDGTALLLPVNTDFNTIKTNGFYRVNTALNAPPKSNSNPANWWYVTVIKHDETYLIQTAFDFNDGVYIRRLVSGVWTKWVRISDEKRHVSILRRNATQMLPSNSYTRLLADTTIYNDGNMWTSDNKFNLKEIGWYRFEIQGSFWVEAGSNLNIEIWKNSSPVCQLASLDGRNISTGRWVSGSYMFNNSSMGDNYEFVAKQTSSFDKEAFYFEMKVIKL